MIKTLTHRIENAQDLEVVVVYLLTLQTNESHVLNLLAHIVKTQSLITSQVAGSLVTSEVFKRAVSAWMGKDVHYKLGKLLFLLDLKSKSIDLGHSSLPLRLHQIMALIVRGNQQGYNCLKDVVQTEEHPNLPMLFGKIVAK